ncbi:cyclin H, partial [Tremellales sp. Uapishka_1]
MAITAMETPAPEASTSKFQLQAGPTAFHETSQFRHWRYSPEQLHDIRAELNGKSVEVVARNTQAEKEAQISLGHDFSDPPPAQAYLTVEDELLLLRFYCSQVSKICQHGFGLPEVVESTAISYLKRFYLKNSVMEWHPKSIMPTCLFLAAKTTNYPVPIETFISKFAKLTPGDVLDLEFVVAQSLLFEFWTRGGEKPLRGWSLELQSQPDSPIDAIQAALPRAVDYLSASRFTDAEFLYTPSQIGLACFRLADESLIDSYLEWKYASAAAEESEQELPFGIPRAHLLEIIQSIQEAIARHAAGEIDLKMVKNVDKRLKSCSNPEKVPGTALYIKRKAEQEASAAEARAVKTIKAQKEMSARDSVFGEVLTRIPAHDGVTAGDGVGMSETGMGIKAEGNGLVFGGKGLKDVGEGLDDD